MQPFAGGNQASQLGLSDGRGSLSRKARIRSKSLWSAKVVSSRNIVSKNFTGLIPSDCLKSERGGDCGSSQALADLATSMPDSFREPETGFWKVSDSK